MFGPGVTEPTIQTTRKTLTFTGASGFGAVNTSATVYTVTGDVLLHALICKCTTNLSESGATATVSLGTVGQLTRFIGNTNSVDIDADEAWVRATPTPGSIDLPDAMQSVLIVSGDDIVVRCLTQGTTAGVLEFTVFWEPVSAGATLVAA